MILSCFSHFSSHTMALTRAAIENIAQLARLELNEAEIPAYQDSLSRILEFVGELERAATERRHADGAPAAGAVATAARGPRQRS